MRVGWSLRTHIANENPMVKITKNIISRADALKVSADYVAFVEGDFSKFNAVDEVFSKLKHGNEVLTYMDGIFIRATVSKVDHNSYQAIDGPVIRVSNGEFSWRVDGDSYAWPILIN